MQVRSHHQTRYFGSSIVALRDSMYLYANYKKNGVVDGVVAPFWAFSAPIFRSKNKEDFAHGACVIHMLCRCKMAEVFSRSY